MSEDKGYNGWTNYETWNVALWIGNEQGSQEYWEVEQAERCYLAAVEADPKENRDGWTESAADDLADKLESELTDPENCPALAQASMYADLLGAALSIVNWHEIAKNYVENIDRDEIETQAFWKVT